MFLKLLFLLIIPATSFSQKPRSFNCGSLKYPKEAEEKEISGKVIVVFDIDSTCQYINFKIEKSVGYGCDEEAIRVLASCNKPIRSAKINCTPKKGVRQVINFQKADEDE